MNERTHTPANQNGFYLMLTLFGEVGDSGFNQGIAQLNMSAWRAQQYPNNTIPPATRAEISQIMDVTSDKWGGVLKAAFRRRAQGVGYTGNMPQRSYPLNLSDVEFDKAIDFAGAEVVDADFSNTIFRKRADFSRAKFSGSVNFENCKFECDTLFPMCHFERDAKFARAEFSQHAIFREARFGSKADFLNFSVKNAVFREAIFVGDATFDNADFSEKAIFLTSDFQAESSFKEAKFGLDTVFSRARFGGFADFYLARLGAGSGKSQSLTFANATFDSPTSFEGATFPDRFPVLSGATLHRTTTFTVEDNHWPPLVPGSFTKLDARLGLRKLSEHEIVQDSAEAKSSAAKLREAMALQALPEDEHFFFRREMHHAARVGTFWHRLPIKLYEAVSDFGFSIWRPAGWLLALWALGTLVYGIVAQMGWWDATGYSFSAMFKFFGFQRTFMLEETKALEAIPWMEFASATQTVLAFILLFFLGLGLRTRFRLR